MSFLPRQALSLLWWGCFAEKSSNENGNTQNWLSKTTHDTCCHVEDNVLILWLNEIYGWSWFAPFVPGSQLCNRCGWVSAVFWKTSRLPKWGDLCQQPRVIHVCLRLSQTRCKHCNRRIWYRGGEKEWGSGGTIMRGFIWITVFSSGQLHLFSRVVRHFVYCALWWLPEFRTRPLCAWDVYWCWPGHTWTGSQHGANSGLFFQDFDLRLLFCGCVLGC